jgi:hypothetical protein
MADTNAIAGIISGLPANQPQQAAPPQPETTVATPQPTSDVVTISAQGKQAVQHSTPYSPTEEQKESSTQKATETQAGKK